MRRILGSPVARAPALAVAVLAFFYFLVNFGAAASPEGSTRGLPVAVVNEDAGAELGGRTVDLGARVVEGATGSEKVGDEVAWTTLPSHGEALGGIARGEYYGALVVPEDYSESVARLYGPPTGKIPDPARIEVLTNSSAGPFASGAVREILTGVVSGASESTSGRIVGGLSARGVRIAPGYAAVLGEPVVAEVVDAQPAGENSGRGLMPFYLTFVPLVLGFVGANALHGGVEGLAGALAQRSGRAPSRPAGFAAKAVLGAVLALVLGAVEALVAFGVYGVHREAGVIYAASFLALVAAVSLLAALALLEAFGARAGVLVGSFLVISLGLATSGGTTPQEGLPGLFRRLADVLPFGRATEGTRALLFYDGRLDAGLGGALWVLAAYLCGALALGGLASLARGRITGRGREGTVSGGGRGPGLAREDERAGVR